MTPFPSGASDGITFVLSQLGFHVAMRFAELLAPLELSLPHVAILNLVASEPGQSQQALATRLDIPANRLVGLLDELEERELLRRERSPSDRRVFALGLTARGEGVVAEVRRLAQAREDELTGFMEPEERAQLARQLRRIADREGLDPRVHPGLRRKLG